MAEKRLDLFIPTLHAIPEFFQVWIQRIEAILRDRSPSISLTHASWDETLAGDTSSIGKRQNIDFAHHLPENRGLIRNKLGKNGALFVRRSHRRKLTSHINLQQNFTRRVDSLPFGMMRRRSTDIPSWGNRTMRRGPFGWSRDTRPFRLCILPKEGNVIHVICKHTK